MDSDARMLEPERKGTPAGQEKSLMDDDGVDVRKREEIANMDAGKEREVADLGNALDRAFGRSEMG